MAVLSREIAKRVKGSLGEKEDHWTLHYDPASGEAYVEHEWSHSNPYKLSELSKEGTQRLSVDGYDGPGKENVAAAIRELMERSRA